MKNFLYNLYLIILQKTNVRTICFCEAGIYKIKAKTSHGYFIAEFTSPPKIYYSNGYGKLT